MDKTYQPKEIETRWYKDWEEYNLFKPKFDNSMVDQTFSLMIPPPNVTGSLHMGHAFQHTIMDALARFNRMNKKTTLWQVGTDHAGIATQMVVERKLANEENIGRHDLGRDAFIKKIWEWKESSGNTITQQMRRLGNSVDWSTERFTMDEGFNVAVQQAFISLYKEKLIYRGKRLVNWDPKLQTAISDLEVENKELDGEIWHLRYPLADNVLTSDNKNYLVVATTRPETMLGDTAVAVNKNDPRYQKLIGCFVNLPFTNRKIPIVADSHANMEKGTGCVKITPAHDFNDYQVGKRNKLPMINILNKNGTIRSTSEIFDSNGKISTCYSNHIPEEYVGKDRFEVRKLIIKNIEKLGLLDEIKPHQLSIPYGDRSNVVIEPMLTDQWYVDAKSLAKPAIDAVETGRIKFVPEQYKNMYFSWMRDIEDWCISRQLWWGHRIPAWYDSDDNIYVGFDESEVRKNYKLDNKLKLFQDEDVLDTWFSSALWTFATLGWPKKTKEIDLFHPTNVLVTGFDIIFFWVARMIMMTMYFIKDEEGRSMVPFKTVYITGLIRDEQGQKMSKSKGNVLDPLDIIDGIDLNRLIKKRTGNMMQPQLKNKIEKQTIKEYPNGILPYGTDALRFTLTSLASTGRDINWDMNRLEGYRNFCNKIWNAARYVLMNVGDATFERDESTSNSPVNLWIISELQIVSEKISIHFENYRFDLASQALYDFIWNEYCDWYLELTKPILNINNSKNEIVSETKKTLIVVLESILRLSHPLMPFITEEIWQTVAPKIGIDTKKEKHFLMSQKFPQARKDLIDTKSIEDIKWVKEIINSIRVIRGEMNISPGKKIEVIFNNGDKTDKRRQKDYSELLISLAKLKTLSWIDQNENLPASAKKIINKLEVCIPLAGNIDKDSELNRIEREITKLENDISLLSKKLGNDNFVSKAPAQVVDSERNKLSKARNDHKSMLEQKNQLLSI